MGRKIIVEPEKWKEINLTIQEAGLDRLSAIAELLLKYISTSETTLAEKRKSPL